MRRIDLVCKLVGPFVISIIDGISTEAAILFNLATSVLSLFAEYYAIARVVTFPVEIYSRIKTLTSPRYMTRFLLSGSGRRRQGRQMMYLVHIPVRLVLSYVPFLAVFGPTFNRRNSIFAIGLFYHPLPTAGHTLVCSPSPVR
jgi:hypothetical protein